MGTVRLGRTELVVEKNGFGALPIQRISCEDAGRLLQRAVEAGINYIDTARAYSDSEEKIGKALSGLRHRFVLATKSHASNGTELRQHLEQSLRLLQTEYIDVYQLHNPAFVPRPGGEDGLCDALLTARQEGKIRFIGITNHRWNVAAEAVESGLYDLLQFPFSYLSGEREVELIRRCRDCDVGFVAMKALAGGLITDSRAAYAFLNQYENVLPIWGVQRDRELDEFISYIHQPPELDTSMKRQIEQDRKQLSGEFCRGCGYCLPCPAGIDIPTMARMSLLLRRAPVNVYTTPEMKAGMKKVEDCTHCRHCAQHCPYGLDTPSLLQENYKDFFQFVAEHSL